MIIVYQFGSLQGWIAGKSLNYTEDIPCKWAIKDSKLIISFDSERFKEDALSSLDKIKARIALRKDTGLKTFTGLIRCYFKDQKYKQTWRADSGLHWRL